MLLITTIPALLLAFFSMGLYALGVSKPIVAELIEAKGGSPAMQKMLEKRGVGNAVITIKNAREFEELIVASRTTVKPMVISLVSSAEADKAQKQGNLDDFRHNITRLSLDAEMGRCSYVVVDTATEHGDGLLDNATILTRIRQLAQVTEAQSQLPLTVVFLGDSLLLPLNSGYLPYEQLRNFIIARVVKK